MKTYIQVRSVDHLDKLPALQHEQKILIWFEQARVGALCLLDGESDPAHLY